jgi:hypothetical protein
MLSTTPITVVMIIQCEYRKSVDGATMNRPSS